MGRSNDTIDIISLAVGIDKKSIKALANDMNKTVDNVEEKFEGIQIEKVLVDKIKKALNNAEKEFKKQSSKFKMDFLKDIFNSNGAEDEINEVFNKFENKMDSLMKLKNQIGNDKIFFGIDTDNLDTLTNKLEKLDKARKSLSNKRGRAKTKADFDFKELEVDYNKDIIKALNNMAKNNPELSDQISDTYRKSADSLRQTIEKYNIENDKLSQELKDAFSRTGHKNKDTRIPISSEATLDKEAFKDFIGFYQSAINKGLDFTALDPDGKMKELFDKLGNNDYYKTFLDDFRNDFGINFDLLEAKSKETGEGIGKGLSNGLGVAEGQINDLIDSIGKLIKKLNDVFSVDGMSTKFDDVASNFKEAIENIDSEDWNFTKLRESLLDIVTQFKNSLAEVNLTSTQLNQAYDMIKGWNDASATTTKVTSNPDRERSTFINSQSGKISNSYFYDAEKSFSGNILKALERLSSGVSGQIGEIYDTWVHSHPIEKGTLGSDVGFSVSDLEVMLESYLKQGVKKMMVTSNYKFTELDLTDVSEEKFKEIIEFFKEELLKAGIEIDNGKFAFPRSLMYEERNGTKVANKDIKTDILNTALTNAISKSGLDVSKVFSTGNIDNLKTDLSQLDKQSDQVSIEFQQLLGVLIHISDVLDEINDKGFKIDNSNTGLTETKDALEQVSQAAKEADENIDNIGKGSGDTKSQQIPEQPKLQDKQQEQQPLDSSLTVQQQTYEKIRQAIDAVTFAIVEEYKAIQAVDVQTDKSVNSEITKLKELEDKLIDLEGKFKGLFGNNDNDDVSGTPTDLIPNVDKTSFETDANNLLDDIKLEKEVLLKPVIDEKSKVEVDATANVNTDTSPIRNDFQDLLGKSFNTSNKIEATDQLRNAYNEFKQYCDDLNKLNTEEGQKAAYNYYKAYEEASNKNIAKSNLERYSVENNNVINEEELKDAIELSTVAMKVFSDVQNELGNIKIDPVVAETASKLASHLHDIAKTQKNMAQNYLPNVYNAESLKESNEYAKSFKDSLKLYMENNKKNGESLESKKIELEPNLDDNTWLTEINSTLDAIRSKVEPFKLDLDINNWITIVEQKISEISGKKVKLDVEADVKAPTPNKGKGDSNNNNNNKPPKIEGTSLSGLGYTEDELNDIYEAAKKANSALTDTVKIVEQIRKDSKDKYAQSFIVTDDKGNKATVNRKGEYYTGQKVVRDDIEQVKQQKEQEKHAKEVADAQKEYEEQLLKDRRTQEEEYTSWWIKELDTREKIQQKRDKETWDEQVKQQKEQEKYLESLLKEEEQQSKKSQIDKYNKFINEDETRKISLQNQEYAKLESTVKEYGELREKIAKNSGIFTDEEKNKLEELENTINSISKRIMDNGLYSSSKDKSILTNLEKIDNNSVQEKAVNDLLSKQRNIYEDIRNIKAKIISLDPNDNAKEIDAQKKLLELRKKEYAENQKILNQNKEFGDWENHLNELLKIKANTYTKISKAQDTVNKKNPSSTNSLDNSDNYSRVNKLLKEQVDTLTQIKYLQNAIESGNLSEEEEIAAKKLMVSLTDKLGAVEGKYNDELTSTYKKTKRIQEVLDRIGKNKDLGVDGFKLDSVINSDKAIKDITDIISALQKTDAAMEKLSHEGKTDIFKTAFEDAQIQIAKLNKQLLSVDIDPKEYSSKINEIINKLSSQKNTVKLINKGDIKNTADLRNTLTDTLNEVTNGTFKMKSFNEETKTMTGTFKNSKGEIQNVSANLDDLENNIGKVNVSFKESTQSATWFSKALTSIGKKFLEVGKYILTYVGMSEVWNTFKQGIKYVVEFDSAMTELIKVSNDSIVALKSFGKESFNIAQQVGGTGTTITQAAADWSRLGYSIKEASELAKNSAIYVNVGDGIDVEQATSSLVSTMKGFGLAAEDSMSIIDKFNEVSNNFAISSGGIGDALQRSAASFKEANTSLDSAIALITATMNKKMVVYMETYAKNTFNCWDSLRALHHNIEETTI